MATLHLLGLFVELVPFRFSGLFALVGAVLELVIIVRAIVEKLWIYLHEELQSVVYHPMNCSAGFIRQKTVRGEAMAHTGSNASSSFDKEPGRGWVV